MAGLELNPDIQGERPETTRLKHTLSWHFTEGGQRKSRQVSRLPGRDCKRKSQECPPPLPVRSFRLAVLLL